MSNRKEENKMKVVIECELTEDCGKISASQINEIADFLAEFFNGKCECFSVEKLLTNE